MTEEKRRLDSLENRSRYNEKKIEHMEQIVNGNPDQGIPPIGMRLYLVERSISAITWISAVAFFVDLMLGSLIIYALIQYAS